MSRALPEWIGATDDAAIPPRVKARVLERACGCCEDCGRAFSAHNPVEIDHCIALINGGENREGNLRALCRDCHGGKTRADLAEKSIVARKRAKHLGFAPRKRLIPGSKGSGFRKRMDGSVIRVSEGYGNGA